MTDIREVVCRPHPSRGLRFVLGLGAAGAILAAVRLACRGNLLDPWAHGGLFVASVGFAYLYPATARVSADARGLHSRTLLRRRSLPWHDVADLHVYMQNSRHRDVRRVSVVLRDGHRRRLPLPWDRAVHHRTHFDAQLDALRAVHRRYGDPESRHVPVVSYRAAGRGLAGWLVLCALLLAGAGLTAWFVPVAESQKAAWSSAVPCTAGTAGGGDCLTTLPAVIARTEVGRVRGPSRLYFADGTPSERLAISREGVQGFRPGDSVELILWRGEVREVVGEHHVWREHFTGAGDVAVAAAACALAAGYPGARVLLRLRGRRLPDDEVLPSAHPFTGALAGTALWLLPLCYLHPSAPLAPPVAITWAAAGSLVTLGLLTVAWRATRVRTPGQAEAAEAARGFSGPVFLAACFLEHTDYNPNGFGTHIVLGDGPPAVTPHPGPGRFAAKRIPVERLTVQDVRRVRGGDGDTVPRGWHIAELDDAGRPVRLAAAPANLIRIIRELGATEGTAAP
ncbi:PH domain-containing protein [Streptomyces spongiicola]|uniref:PH domain-containing protein n=1 Tax=Streptomyces spongiicola TaxID=1690221 RepID=UPI0033C6A059